MAGKLKFGVIFHILNYLSNQKIFYIWYLLYDDCYLLLAFCELLSVTWYLNLFIWNSQLLAKTCFFRSLLYMSYFFLDPPCWKPFRSVFILNSIWKNCVENGKFCRQFLTLVGDMVLNIQYLGTSWVMKIGWDNLLPGQDWNNNYIMEVKESDHNQVARSSQL